MRHKVAAIVLVSALFAAWYFTMLQISYIGEKSSVNVTSKQKDK